MLWHSQKKKKNSFGVLLSWPCYHLIVTICIYIYIYHCKFSPQLIMLYIFGDLLWSQSVTIKSQKQFLGFHCFVGLATTDTSYIKKVGDFLLHKKWKLIWWLCFLGLSSQNRHVTESLNPSTNYAILGDSLWSQVKTIKVPSRASASIALLVWLHIHGKI